jgi:hypothetical protein
LTRGNPCASLGCGVGVCGRCYLLEGTIAVILTLLRVSVENLISLDRAMKALLCHVLLEDTALQFIVCGSMLVAWRRRGIQRAMCFG